MSHFVFRTKTFEYVGTRKALSQDRYCARTSTTKELSEARVFNTQSAATNAGRSAGLVGQAEQVRVYLGDV